LKKFSKETKIYLIIQTLFSLSTSLSSVFVNVYMWRLTSNMTVIGMYNIVAFAVVPIAFILAGFIGRKKSIITCTRLGILGYLLFYAMIILMQGSVKNHLILLGVLYGIGVGFYNFGNNTLIYNYTENDNRGYYLGISTALSSIMTTIAPVISGVIIISRSELNGYYIVFFISFFLFIISIILSSFLRPHSITGKYEFKKILFNKQDKPWNKILICSYILGLKDGAFSYVVNILIFLVFKSELGMGNFTTITSVLGIVSAFMVGKYCKKAIQNKVFFIGSVMCFLGTVVLVLFTNYFGVILNGVLTSVFTCFWSIPFTTIMYDIAGKSSEKSNNIADYMIVREIPTALGRISGIALYIVVSINFMDKTAIKLILPLLSFMVVLNYIYFNRREKEKLDVVV